MSAPIHRWYSRPVLFVADVQRALRFYLDSLGFKTDWHESDGKGTVCQVSRSDCEIILCQDATRRDKARLFIELTATACETFAGSWLSGPSLTRRRGGATTQPRSTIPTATSSSSPSRTERRL